jgi:membrane protein
MKVGVLGGLGVGLLLYTVISLIQKIESSFNYTWHTTQTRSLGQRFSNYLSVVMVGPVLIFAAMGLTATVLNNEFVQRMAAIEPFGTLLATVTQLLPYLLVIAAFSFVYMFVPNTRVRPMPAIVGGIIGGVLWEATGKIFAVFVVGSAKYTAVYSGFAILLFFMIWLYLSWLILLIGASIAFYVQHPEHLTAHRALLRLSSRLKERLALLTMTRIGQAHAEGAPPWTLERLAGWLGLPPDVVGIVLHALRDRGLLLETASDPAGYVPARNPDALQVREILESVRSAEETPELSAMRMPAEARVDELVARLDQARASALQDQTLGELCGTEPRASG